ncbi:unnamed protein product [Protopolystoma xenopodis]|uniref:Secreted protein n=1 Tax=Protopolystoma xenopodis TaxID=117903 RepID=A0A448WSK1_9PLAT|nr:unnamed protein product [Protopolystoma xenopodis]
MHALANPVLFLLLVASTCKLAFSSSLPCQTRLARFIPSASFVLKELTSSHRSARQPPPRLVLTEFIFPCPSPVVRLRLTQTTRSDPPQAASSEGSAVLSAQLYSTRLFYCSSLF